MVDECLTCGRKISGEYAYCYNCYYKWKIKQTLLKCKKDGTKIPKTLLEELEANPKLKEEYKKDGLL